ncbi:MAG: MATE family efflux transporter [Coriobacteriales bacterium]|nr:MATE family efflux transporter [Coriobacteriales bacterium]MBQ6586351.1 MATE family efflux transporter [Coriobacteriales bacterium]
MGTKDLLRYTAPTMAAMVFGSIYGVVDGLFISNCAGKTAFAAVNFVWPIIMILSTIGFMIGSGGSALVSTTRGRGDDELANRQFSLLSYFSISTSAVLAVLGFIFMGVLVAALGAEGELLRQGTLYGRICMFAIPFACLALVFEPFLTAAGKPELSLKYSVIAGCTNIVLDALFVWLLDWGVAGAAAATSISSVISGGCPLLYFMRPNDSFLRLGRTSLDWRCIGKACTNGCSEMVSSLAMNVVSTVYNVQLLHYLGEDGVAAYGILMYVSMIFSALFVGYTMGSAPLMSFQNGAGNNVEKRSLLRHGLAIISVGAVMMFCASELLAVPLSRIFASYDADLLALTIHAFRIYSLSFLFMGFAIYASSLFTSLENGVVSAIISFVRTLVFEAGAVLLLPVLFGAESIWYSFLVAEVAATVLSAVFLLALSRRYGFRD